MNRKNYDLAEAQALLPLLDSILREMEERRKELGHMEQTKRRLSGERPEGDEEVRYLVADIANHRRELRHADEELDQLGCTLEEGETVLVRIPGANDGWVWSPGGELEPAAATAA